MRDVSHDALRSQRVVAMWSPRVDARGDHDQTKTCSRNSSSRCEVIHNAMIKKIATAKL
jgi:hypothetical protein